MNSKNTKKDNKNNQSDFYIKKDQRESRFLHSQKEMTLKMNIIDAYKNVNIQRGMLFISLFLHSEWIVEDK